MIQGGRMKTENINYLKLGLKVEKGCIVMAGGIRVMIKSGV